MIFASFFVLFVYQDKKMSTEEIWNRFCCELEQFIKNRVNDKTVADDLLQEIFIKIHLKKDSLKESNKLTAWVYQIARNVIIDYYRQRKPEFAGNEFPEQVETESDEQVRISFNQCIMPFVEKLEPKYKDAFLQTSFGHLSQKEYAEKLQISYSGAKSRVQRARKMVKDLFLACCPVICDKYGNIIDGGKCGCTC